MYYKIKGHRGTNGIRGILSSFDFNEHSKLPYLKTHIDKKIFRNSEYSRYILHIVNKYPGDRYLLYMQINKFGDLATSFVHAILVCISRVNLDEHSAKVDTVR